MNWYHTEILEEVLLSKKQAALFLNRTEDNLSTMHFSNECKVPFVKKGKMIFYRVTDLEDLLRNE